MKNQIKTILLLGVLSALVVGVAASMAPSLVYLAFALALAMNLGAYFFSAQIVLRMHRAREVSRAQEPELHAIVDELSERAGIPKPRICIIPDSQPNAFATGRSPKYGVVAVTQGILGVLNRRELRGVIAHELAHIKNRDILLSSIAAVAASVITYAAQALSFGSLFGSQSDEEGSEGSSAGGGILVALLAPVAATLIQLGISRSREYAADELGAQMSGDPEALARALLKLDQSSGAVPVETAPATASLFIVNPFGAARSLSRWFSTHPSTQERVVRLRAMALPRRRGSQPTFSSPVTHQS